MTHLPHCECYTCSFSPPGAPLTEEEATRLQYLTELDENELTDAEWIERGELLFKDYSSRP